MILFFVLNYFISNIHCLQLGINVATGQMSKKIPDSQWISWVCNENHSFPIHFKYFWRDVNQLNLQKQNCPTTTSAVITIQNDELPVSFETAMDILYPYTEYKDIIYLIAIGNEADTKWLPNDFIYKVTDSIKNTQKAVLSLNMPMKVTTPLSLSVFNWEEMMIQEKWRDPLIEILSFYRIYGTPFMINIYPYLSWYHHQDLYSLDEALSTLFIQKIENIKNLLSELGFKDIKICIGETGWPTEGSDGAQREYASIYWSMINSLSLKNIDGLQCIYWFELIDEDQKIGDVDEHFYGKYSSDGKLKY